MGSFFAGIKAGTLAGVAYLGGLALFNVFLLYALKSDALQIISQSYSQVCGVNSANLEECFTAVVVVYIPLIAFLGFFASLLYAGLFGRYYESFPGRSPILKGEVLGAVVGLNLLFFDLTGVYFDLPARVGLGVFFFFWTAVYGFAMGKLYRRYTRLVKFRSQDGASIRILVDGRDYTRKEMTFAFSSTHQVRADVAEGTSFKEWASSGGIVLEDSRAFETAMEVSGDGMLEAHGTEKY